jgi:hypothetical protein
VNRLLIFLFEVGLAAAHGEVPGPAADRLVEAVRAELPKGWSASCDKAYTRLKISRDQPVLMQRQIVPNDGGPKFDAAGKWIAEKLTPQQYYFDFEIVPKISLADHQRLTGENAELEKLQGELYEQLVKMRTSQKFDSFSPGTKEQEAVVARYNAVKNARHELPDFYFGDLGLEWGWNSPERTNSPLYIHSTPGYKTVGKECERVQEKVTHVFTKYDDEVKARPVPNL